MKNKIMNKLRSEKGASITFALLLFLVCAVLSSVILAAATAAAGRMSKIAESDQRYYAVTSAAELLKDLLDGKSVSVVGLKETQVTTVYKDGAKISETPGSPSVKTYVVDGKKAADIDKAIDCVDGNLITNASSKDTISEIVACNVNFDSAGKFSEITPINKKELTLDSNLGSSYYFLTTTINESMDGNGSLTFDIFNKYKSSGVESAEGSKFTAHMVFGVNMSITKRLQTEDVSSTPGADGSLSVVTNEIEMNIVTLTWTLTGISF
nr:hypothetical protein [uncultured Butyrivibrio sp.]